MGRKLSPANDEIDPALLRELMSAGDQRLLSDDEISKLKAATVEAMRAAGVRPALIYAYERTGLIVTRENRKLMSAADLDEWEDAIAEHRERYEGSDAKGEHDDLNPANDPKLD